MENFYLNLEVSNPMTHQSRNEKGPPHAERRIHRDLMSGQGGKKFIVAVIAEVV